MFTVNHEEAKPARWPDYRAVWRWHFYSSLFCIPFVVLLAISGGIYLFKPQLDRWEDRNYNDLAIVGEKAPASAIVQAAREAVSEGQAVALELPEKNNDAMRVIVKRGDENLRVFVHPASLEVLGMRGENATWSRWLRELHGQLHLGIRGSYLVELASSWTVIMIVTGLCLWWPRQLKGLGGVLYPRLGRSSHIFWRDLHSVTGIWISFLALFLLATGLPWAKFWGEYFRSIRSVVQTVSTQDWTLGGEEVRNNEHANHGVERKAGSHMGKQSGSGGRKVNLPIPENLASLDVVVSTAQELNLAFPVIISPAADESTKWIVKSDAQNRTLRVNCHVDGVTGKIISREDFTDKPWMDRLISIGIAAHEGQLFGWFNQLLGVVTAMGLIVLSCSGYVMWWRRRPKGGLGAPLPLAKPCWRWPLVFTVILLAAYLPMFGLSLIGVLLCEKMLGRFVS